MSNRLNEADFEAMLSTFSPAVQGLARGARRLVLDALPESFEIVWVRQKIVGYGTGPKKMTEHFCWLAPFRDYASLGFYYGSELPDPAKLLEGTGTRMRHVKVRSRADLSNPALRTLVELAIKHRVPPPLPLGANGEPAGAKPAAKAGARPAAKPAAKAGARPAAKPAAKAGARPAAKAAGGAKAATKAGRAAKATPKRATKAGAQAATKAGAKGAAKARPAAKRATKAGPVAKRATKASAPARAKKAARAGAKSRGLRPAPGGPYLII
jgi:hypothetical protein